MDPEQYHVFDEPIQKGFAAALENGVDKDLTQFDIAPFVTMIMGDDVEQCPAAALALLPAKLAQQLTEDPAVVPPALRAKRPRLRYSHRPSGGR